MDGLDSSSFEVLNGCGVKVETSIAKGIAVC